MENRLSHKLFAILCADNEYLNLITNTVQSHHGNVMHIAGNWANNEANGYSITEGVWKKGPYSSFNPWVIEMNKTFEVKYEPNKVGEAAQ